MALPAAIQLDPSSILLTNSLARVSVISRNRVIFEYATGKNVEYAFSTPEDQYAFFDQIKLLFDVGVRIYSISPCAMEVGSDPLLTIRGIGFNADATITIKLEGDTGTYTNDLVQPTVNGAGTEMTIQASDMLTVGGNLTDSIAISGDPWFVKFRVQYTDTAGATSNWLFSNQNETFTVFAHHDEGASAVNPVVFDAINSDPTTAVYTPPDTAKGCFWFGVGGTFYSWNPDTTAWVGVITL